MFMYFRCLALILLSSFMVLPVAAFNYQSLPEIPGNGVMDEDEELLVTALVQVHDSNLDEALKTLKRVVDRNPKFRLARLIYGDLLMARSGVIRPFGGRSSLSDSGLDNLLSEARQRLQYRLSPPPRGALPEQLLQLSETQRYAIVVDVSESRLYVYEQRDGEPVLIGDYYATTGMGGALKQKEGDGRTPLGVYFITSRLEGDKLPDLYGAGAFPINYPNEWDSLRGRTGYGIWIHGVPSNTYNRAPRETYGCIAIPNNSIINLWNLLEGNSTPVILTRTLNWVARSELQKRRFAMRRTLEAWRRDVQNPQFKRDARYYSRNFSTVAGNDAAFLKTRFKAPGGRPNTALGLSDVSFFSYPGEPDIVVATFNRELGHGKTRTRERIRQYWRHESDGQWRIVYEGPARFKKIHLQGIPPSARAGIGTMFR